MKPVAQAVCCSGHSKFTQQIRCGLSAKKSTILLVLAMPIVGNSAENVGSAVERSLLGSPSSERFGLPEIPTRNRDIPIESVLPRVDENEKSEFISQKQSLYISKIKLIGDVGEISSKISELLKAYQNRTVTLSELFQLRQKLTNHFISQGYINSGAKIPDQIIENGIVTIELTKGNLKAINIRGQSALSERYIRSRLTHDSISLNINDIGERLLRLQKHPVINSIKAELVPGNQQGEAILNAQVIENSPYSTQLSINNLHSPSIGEYSISGTFVNHSLTQRGDSLSFSSEWSEGLKNAALEYSIPISINDTLLNFFFQVDDTVVVEAPFQHLDIQGSNKTVGISLFHPFIRNQQTTFSSTFGLELKRSKTKLLDIPFDFSPGSIDGTTQISSFYSLLDWTNRQQDSVFAARSTLRIGIGAFSASVADNLPDSRFVSWLGQFQAAQRLNSAGHKLLFKTEAQLANDALVTAEKYALGGMRNVRGYRTNQLVRDNAWFASLEYHIPLSQMEEVNNSLQAVIFSDYGKGWNDKSTDSTKTTLSSIGVGIIWQPNKKIGAELYWGHSLNNLKTPGDSIQDNGVYFNFVYRPN